MLLPTTMKQFLISLSLVSIYSCSNVPQPDANRSISSDSKIANDSIVVKNIEAYVSDTSYYHWRSRKTDSTSYSSSIIFHKGRAAYAYHGQCIYTYTTRQITNDIDLLWSYEADCILDMDILEKGNSIASFPKKGDRFATYQLVNNSTLQATYYFPDWVNRINELKKDSLFPVFFYLER
jgi:hypothetical protein